MPAPLAPARKQKYCFIDVETTGLTPGKNSIIQLSGCIDIDGELVESFNWLCQPFPGAEVRSEALKANNISLASLQGLPDADHTTDMFRTMCYHYVSKYDTKDKMFFIAYNSRFDEDFIRSHFTRLGDKFYGSIFWTPSVCVMQMSIQRLMKERHLLPDFKLGTVASHILGRDVTQDGLHDASVDITITRELFYALRK